MYNMVCKYKIKKERNYKGFFQYLQKLDVYPGFSSYAYDPALKAEMSHLMVRYHFVVTHYFSENKGRNEKVGYDGIIFDI